MKSYVIFLFFLFVFSARLAGQHTLPVTILPSAQTGSPGVMSLNGTWKFMMLPSLQSAIPDGWIKSEFNDLDWNEIHVPGNWEPQGFKQPEYGHDLTACMGLYRTHFSIPSDWKKQRVVLRFDGVHMGYECWVNGQFAGDYGSGSNPCNFDITPFLQTGNNTLCVKVTTRSFAWKFDTMDNWTFCGINRDVTLFTLPHQYIEDITFISENCMDNEADIQVRVQTQGNI
ncbi:glycoside hydrolase family 2, partial [Phocaeicola dorei]